MLALVTLATWQAVAVGALIALFLTLWLSARRWSVKRLVMIRVHYKDGADKDFITFPWRLKMLYKALEGNPRTLLCRAYEPAISIDSDVETVCFCRFKHDPWLSWQSLHFRFQWQKLLWHNQHALLVSVLRDFGLEDSQPLDPGFLASLSHQKLSVHTMRLGGRGPSFAFARDLSDNQIGYLQRLRECLDAAMEKKWTRDVRHERLNNNLPGTRECAMALLATDEGAQRVIACIRRDWQPEPTPATAPLPRHGGHC